MKNLRLISWLLFLSAFFILCYQDSYVRHHSTNYDILRLELADSDEGAHMLNRFNNTMVELHTQLYFVRLNTMIDFVFIFGYVAVLIIISYWLMQRQKNKSFNNLLRLCFLMAFIAGMLDLFENFILLHNLYDYYAGKHFMSTMYVSYPKWSLVGIILLCWVIALLNNLFFAGKNQYLTKII